METDELLRLISEAHKQQREDIKASADNHQLLCEEAIANLAALTTIRDASHCLEALKADPTT